VKHTNALSFNQSLGTHSIKVYKAAEPILGILRFWGMSDTTPTHIFTHDDILIPLMITVVIDNKVRDPELAEFIVQANGLFPLFNLPLLSDEDIISWFKSQEATLAQKLKGKRKNTTILVALSRFTNDMHVENLYEAMIAISVSDKEYKREESDLVRSAASIWGYNRPPLKVCD